MRGQLSIDGLTGDLDAVERWQLSGDPSTHPSEKESSRPYQPSGTAELLITEGMRGHNVKRQVGEARYAYEYTVLTSGRRYLPDTQLDSLAED